MLELSNDVHMSDAKGAGRSVGSQNQDGVLAHLPRTRPQRSSARRAAARRTAAGSSANGGPPKGSSATPVQNTVGGPASAGRSRKPTTEARKRAAREARRAPGSQRRPDAAPRQGFEAESENMSGSVQPPGNAEFIASAAEVVSELAKAGLSTGERVLRDVLSRLPRA
jgi:hypothetical protein